MSDVFISYKSERKLAAEHFAEVLKCHGYSVWFDYSLVKGSDFAEQIDRQIRQAKVVVVLWCAMSVTSRWVREEAYLAQKLGILIPVKIEACDMPFGFQLDDTLDLIEWNGSPRSHELDRLIDEVERKVGRVAAPDRRALIEFESHWRRYGAQPLRTFGLGQPVEPDNGGLPSLLYETSTGESIHYTMFAPDAKVRRRFKLWEKAELRAKRQTPISYEDAEQRLVRSFVGHSGRVISVAFSPDGRLILSGSQDATLKLWETGTGKELRSLAGHSDSVLSVSFSPDERLGLSGSCDETIKLWDLAMGNELCSFEWHSEAVASMVFSSDNRFALSGNDDHTMKLWDVSAEKELRSFDGHLDMVSSVAFSLDGHFALSGSDDKTVRLWNVTTGKELRSFTGHSHELNSVAFSRDGHLALSGSYDHTLKLWDIATGKELHSFAGHAAPVTSVAFSPDGHFTLSGSHDDTVKLWDARTGEMLRSFAGHSAWVEMVVFSPDGRLALSGSDDAMLKLWDISEWTQAK